MNILEMNVGKRLSLLILSAIILAFVANLAINAVEISIQQLKHPRGVMLAPSLRTTPKTTTVEVTKTVTPSTTTTITKAPMALEEAQKLPKEVERAGRGVQGEIPSLLLNISASLIIAASSFLLLRRVFG